MWIITSVLTNLLRSKRNLAKLMLHRFVEVVHKILVNLFDMKRILFVVKSQSSGKKIGVAALITGLVLNVIVEITKVISVNFMMRKKR